MTKMIQYFTLAAEEAGITMTNSLKGVFPSAVLSIRMLPIVGILFWSCAVEADVLDRITLATDVIHSLDELIKEPGSFDAETNEYDIWDEQIQCRAALNSEAMVKKAFAAINALGIFRENAPAPFISFPERGTKWATLDRKSFQQQSDSLFQKLFSPQKNPVRGGSQLIRKVNVIKCEADTLPILAFTTREANTFMILTRQDGDALSLVLSLIHEITMRHDSETHNVVQYIVENTKYKNTQDLLTVQEKIKTFYGYISHMGRLSRAFILEEFTLNKVEPRHDLYEYKIYILLKKLRRHHNRKNCMGVLQEIDHLSSRLGITGKDQFDAAEDLLKNGWKILCPKPKEIDLIEQILLGGGGPRPGVRGG